MFNIAEAKFQGWQQRLKASRRFRLFWIGFGIYVILPLAVYGAYLLQSAEGRKILLMAVVALVLARGVFCELVYFLYKKERPYQAYKFLQPVAAWLFSPRKTKFDSFPSGHAASMSAISGILFIFSPFVGILAFGVTVLTGMARVVLGYHYPTDILAGIAVGLISAYLTYLFLYTRLFTL